MREPVFEKGYPSYEAVNDIYDTTEIRLQDENMLITLHNVARIMEEADNTFHRRLGSELRKIADRFSDLTNKAHNRKHWTGRE